MKPARSRWTGDQPETMRQARRFDAVCNQARSFGLCARCAPQLAFGHQLGFTRVHAPCVDCLPLLERLPVGQPNEWRSVEGSAASKSAWTNWDLSTATHTYPPRTPGAARAVTEPRLGTAGRGSYEARSHS